jgi:hypothetical protein
LRGVCEEVRGSLERLKVGTSERPEKTKRKRDFSLRKPTHSQERKRKKKRRPAPFEMTDGKRPREGKKESP